MKKTYLIALAIPLLWSATFGNGWIKLTREDYTIFYTRKDQKSIVEYDRFFQKGVNEVTDFFKTPFKDPFSIYVHPTRESLDSTWQKDWAVANFKSKCWMVASGVSEKMDIISPKAWDSLSCEHKYTDTLKTYRLIKHELVHVFHGQRNKSPNFDVVMDIDWLVEGLATYASGQCDKERINEVKKMILKQQYPKNLKEFWRGNVKYGLSGTMMMYIDGKYGRTKLLSLLAYNDLTSVLHELQISEEELIKEWIYFLKHI